MTIPIRLDSKLHVLAEDVGSGPCEIIRQSSAYKWQLERFVLSLINRITKSKPNIDPWGTLVLTGFCILNIDLVCLAAGLILDNMLHFLTRTLWPTQLKAF